MSKKNTKNISTTPKLLTENTPFAIKEAFNQLRTNLMYMSHDGDGCPVYAITSATENVGKSTISSNLAIAYSQINKKVLLIDADMRLPVQYNVFGYDRDKAGLSELLSDIVKNYKEVLVSPMPNLDIVPSGCLPPNPSELITSNKFYELMEKWKREYDIIFIDLPPAGVVSDPIAISSLVSGYILVAMTNKSDAKHIKTVIANIENVGSKIVGLVLNGTNIKGRLSKYSYQHKYYYGSYRYAKQ
jgi:capsular exopolysaccharide synthesis family protein